MSTPHASITEWLNGSRAYARGVELWLAHKESSQNQWLESLLRNGPCPVSTRKLLSELQSFNGTEPTPKAKNIRPSSPKNEPLQKKTLSLSPYKNDDPHEVIEARQRIKQVYTELTTFRTEIRMSEGKHDDKWRAARAAKVIQLTRERRRLLDFFDVYEKTGELPKEDMVLMTRDQVQAMIRDYKNDYWYLGSYKKNPAKQEECARRQARLNEIEEFLNT